MNLTLSFIKKIAYPSFISNAFKEIKVTKFDVKNKLIQWFSKAKLFIFSLSMQG
jgi:hypothetical protein